MKYGINMDCFEGLEPKNAAKLMKENGFSTTFVGTYYPKLDEFFAEAEANGIEVEFMHAPFRGINDMWKPTLEGEAYLKALTDAVDICEEHSVKALVCHISSGVNPPNINDVGFLRFERLVEYAKAKNVRIAFENIRKLANHAYMLEKLPDATFCWDTGHEECFAYGLRFMPIFGNRLDVVHIHDNFCKFNGDEHLLPFDGCIDFDRVAKSIAEANLNNSLMLEVSNVNEIYKNTSPEEYFSKAAIAVKELITKIEKYS